MSTITHRLDLNFATETNLFLRALWANLRVHYGKLGWQFTPRRFGEEKRIRFGWMSLGASSHACVEVSIFYKRIGIAAGIEFILKDGIDTVYPNIIQIIDQCVKLSQQNFSKPLNKMLYCLVSSNPGINLGSYAGQNWCSIPLSNGLSKIGILLEGFDDADLQHEFAYKSEQLLDALCCMTNVCFRKEPWDNDVAQCDHDATNKFYQTADWLDDFPILDNRLGLLKLQIDYLDRLMNGEVTNLDLVRAAHIFHRAVPLYRNLREYNDVAIALFCSALETLSLSSKKNDKCSLCGQPQYSISQRINDLVAEQIGGGITRIVKSAYESRSLYLHTGQSKVSREPTQHIIPQLDPNGVEGCAALNTNVQVNVLMESTSFLFRRLISSAIN